MQVEAIQGNDRRRSVFVPMANGAAIGAVGGFALKYMYPLTHEEKNTDEYIKVANKIKNEKVTYNFRTAKYIDSIKANPERSYAQDQFVKLFDGLKDGDKVKTSKLRSVINTIKKEKPDELLEFRRVCKASSEVAEQTAKQCMSAYNLITKHIRPTGFFLLAGAIVGAIIGLIQDVTKTDVKA